MLPESSDYSLVNSIMIKLPSTTVWEGMIFIPICSLSRVFAIYYESPNISLEPVVVVAAGASIEMK